MDPLGFALENFDAVGAWRTKDGGAPIDTSGQLADGATVDGVVAMRQAILSRPELFVSTMTEKLLVFGLGRGIDYRDMPVVREIVRRAARSDYRFSSLVLGVVDSVPFRMRKSEAPSPELRARGAGTRRQGAVSTRSWKLSARSFKGAE